MKDRSFFKMQLKELLNENEAEKSFLNNFNKNIDIMHFYDQKVSTVDQYVDMLSEQTLGPNLIKSAFHWQSWKENDLWKSIHEQWIRKWLEITINPKDPHVKNIDLVFPQTGHRFIMHLKSDPNFQLEEYHINNVDLSEFAMAYFSYVGQPVEDYYGNDLFDIWVEIYNAGEYYEEHIESYQGRIDSSIAEFNKLSIKELVEISKFEENKTIMKDQVLLSIKDALVNEKGVSNRSKCKEEINQWNNLLGKPLNETPF